MQHLSVIGTPELPNGVRDRRTIAVEPAATNNSQRGDRIRVRQIQNPAGEATCRDDTEHILFLGLSPRPVRMLQIQDGKTYTGMYKKGDLCIAPAQSPLFARWESEDRYLQIRLPAQFVQRVARETLDRDRLELLPEFQARNPQIEAIGTMLLAELQQEQPASRLYLDSLANVLAVNLLRHHAATKPQLPIYEGGLPPAQLMRVLDYIDTCLDREIKLAELASLLDMSSFHFSRLFKQSLGIPPYQYLVQQRIERAKQLLKQTDRAIAEIAFDCGFSSHSHLSNQFRKLTGMTPKAFRAS